MSDTPANSDLLSQFQPGQRGKVLAIELPGSIRGRILEMGLTLGTTVEVVRFAPLGDPIELKVRGAHLSLRKTEAAGIRLQRL